jgi:hypothetical protein
MLASLSSPGRCALIVWLYALVLGLDIGLTHLLIAIPATTIVELVPISINGVGVREDTSRWAHPSAY